MSTLRREARIPGTRILRQLIDRVAAAVEQGMRREPVATAVALGLIAAGATAKFSGFVVGVVAAALIAHSARVGSEREGTLPRDRRYARQAVRESA